jgi:hypothetical protein
MDHLPPPLRLPLGQCALCDLTGGPVPAEVRLPLVSGRRPVGAAAGEPPRPQALRPIDNRPRGGAALWTLRRADASYCRNEPLDGCNVNRYARAVRQQQLYEGRQRRLCLAIEGRVQGVDGQAALAVQRRGRRQPQQTRQRQAGQLHGQL